MPIAVRETNKGEFGECYLEYTQMNKPLNYKSVPCKR